VTTVRILIPRLFAMKNNHTGITMVMHYYNAIRGPERKSSEHAKQYKKKKLTKAKERPKSVFVHRRREETRRIVETAKKKILVPKKKEVCKSSASFNSLSTFRGLAADGSASFDIGPHRRRLSGEGDRDWLSSSS